MLKMILQILTVQALDVDLNLCHDRHHDGRGHRHRLVRCTRHSFPKLVARTKRADVGFHSSQYSHLSQNSIVTPCALFWVNSEVENGTIAVVS